MNIWEKKRIRKLENAAAALAAIDDTVTVQISVPLAWLIRDWIGFGQFHRELPDVPQNKPGFMPDMERLNDVLGYRPAEDNPSVQRWSKDLITERTERKIR